MTAFEIAILWVLAFVFSYLLDYLAEVLPQTRRFTSYECAYCRHPIPLKEFLLLSNCSSCLKPRKQRIYFIILTNVLLFFLLCFFPTTKIPSLFFLIISQYFLLIIIHDIEHRIVLNQMSLIGAAISGVVGMVLHNAIPTLEGAATGFFVMLAFYFLGLGFNKLLSRIRNKEIDEIALGFGDVYLSGIIGTFLGWPLILAGVFFAIMGAGIISAGIILARLIIKNYQPFEAIPYAPFLALSGVILLFLNVR
jgi:leader peptidase (prepilin peptidase)/N-methyltransferase